MKKLLGVAAATLTVSVAAPALAQEATTVAVDTGTLKGTTDRRRAQLERHSSPRRRSATCAGAPRSPPPSGRASRDASAYGNDCMQVPFPSDAALLGTPPAEDCLYANIWRPANGAKKLPWCSGSTAAAS